MAITLQELYDKVAEYHEKLPYPEKDIDPQKYANDIILALHAEVDELMRSYSWKPWKPERRANYQNMYIEIVDILFFLVEFMEVFDLKPDKLEEVFYSKLVENYKRIERGYHKDGSN